MGSANWQPVLVPLMFRHFTKVRPVSISWYHQPHVYMRVVRHIWREIGVVIWNILVVHDTIKLLLKFRVIFEVLKPVIRIWL